MVVRPVEKTSPPFEEAAQIADPAHQNGVAPCLFPAFYQSRKGQNTYSISSVRSTKTIYDCRLRRINTQHPTTVRDYLEESFEVERLNKVHSWLWIAGLPKLARPLHKQLCKGRSIVITEQADCHLVWQNDKILLKPLPEYLLVTETWHEYLSQRDHIRKSALSFVLSYLWLICEYSDFCIAKQNQLLPAIVEWHQWRTFAASLYDHLYEDGELKIDVLPRYRYGELRLQRLNHVYRLHALHPHNCRPALLIHGYREMYTTYTSFLQNHTRWLVTVVIYVSVVLAAMQVGSATGRFDTDSFFNTTCVYFSLITILLPLSVLAIAIVLFLISFGFNARYALSAKQMMLRKLREKQHPQP